MGKLTTAQAAFLGGYSVMMTLVVLALYVLMVVAVWRIFTKAGVAGWKSLIPFYNEYLIYKMSWKTKFFWIALGLAIVGAVVAALDPGTVSYYSTQGANIAVANHTWVYYVGNLIMLASVVFTYITLYRLCVSFGHGAGFFILMLFLPNIALLYLGFSQDTYQGNLTE